MFAKISKILPALCLTVVTCQKAVSVSDRSSKVTLDKTSPGPADANVEMLKGKISGHVYAKANPTASGIVEKSLVLAPDLAEKFELADFGLMADLLTGANPSDQILGMTISGNNIVALTDKNTLFNASLESDGSAIRRIGGLSKITIPPAPNEQYAGGLAFQNNYYFMLTHLNQYIVSVLNDQYASGDALNRKYGLINFAQDLDTSTVYLVGKDASNKTAWYSATLSISAGSPFKPILTVNAKALSTGGTLSPYNFCFVAANTLSVTAKALALITQEIGKNQTVTFYPWQATGPNATQAKPVVVGAEGVKIDAVSFHSPTSTLVIAYRSAQNQTAFALLRPKVPFKIPDGIVVYFDDNQNGVKDDAEKSASVSKGGDFTIDDVKVSPNGSSFHLMLALPQGFVANPNFFDITLDKTNLSASNDFYVSPAN